MSRKTLAKAEEEKRLRKIWKLLRTSFHHLVAVEAREIRRGDKKAKRLRRVARMSRVVSVERVEVAKSVTDRKRRNKNILLLKSSKRNN